MEGKPKNLEIAFMGYNTRLTKITFIQFTRDNRAEIEQYSRTWCGPLKLKDGTRITAITPDRARSLDGYRLDQLILADDSRRKIFIDRGDAIDALLYGALAYSYVPEEYKILFYDLDAPEPENETGKGAGERGKAL